MGKIEAMRKLSAYRKWVLFNGSIRYQIEKKLHFFCISIGIPFCKGFYGPCFRKGYKRRQATAYVDDNSNWTFLCDRCSEENNKHWYDQWNDYYSQCM